MLVFLKLVYKLLLTFDRSTTAASSPAKSSQKTQSSPSKQRKVTKQELDLALDESSDSE